MGPQAEPWCRCTVNQEKLERIAEVLVAAFLNGDRKTAERYGVTDRTLRNWRKLLDSEPKLSELFRAKKAQASEGWANEVPGAIRSAVTFLRRAAEEGDCRDPNMVHSIAGAMKLLSETAATWRLLDARLARSAGGQPEQRPSPLPN